MIRSRAGILDRDMCDHVHTLGVNGRKRHKRRRKEHDDSYGQSWMRTSQKMYPVERVTFCAPLTGPETYQERRARYSAERTI